MFDDKAILVTGGTGSFGHKFVEMTLKKYKPSRLVIYSRDEMKQWEMAKLYPNNDKVRFFIGDVRDKDRLARALDGIDFVVHAAATKIVPTAEYNPFECVKTNVFGAMNLIDACIDKGVKRIVALSTDKASNPANLYGATKLTADRLFISANANSGEHETIFSVVRYGNVLGSRGSVVPIFLRQKENNKNFTITDKRMTRFNITLSEAVTFVLNCIKKMKGGEIFVPKIPSFFIRDLAKAIDKDLKTKLIKSSSLSPQFKKSNLILELCQKVGASVYLSGPFGRDYLDEDLFSSAGIEMIFQQYM